MISAHTDKTTIDIDYIPRRYIRQIPSLANLPNLNPLNTNSTNLFPSFPNLNGGVSQFPENPLNGSLGQLPGNGQLLGNPLSGGGLGNLSDGYTAGKIIGDSVGTLVGGSVGNLGGARGQELGESYGSGTGMAVGGITGAIVDPLGMAKIPNNNGSGLLILPLGKQSSLQQQQQQQQTSCNAELANLKQQVLLLEQEKAKLQIGIQQADIIKENATNEFQRRETLINQQFEQYKQEKMNLQRELQQSIFLQQGCLTRETLLNEQFLQQQQQKDMEIEKQKSEIEEQKSEIEKIQKLVDTVIQQKKENNTTLPLPFTDDLELYMQMRKPNEPIGFNVVKVNESNLADRLKELYDANGRSYVSFCYNHIPNDPFINQWPASTIINDTPESHLKFNGNMDASWTPENGGLDRSNYLNSVIFHLKAIGHPYLALCYESVTPNHKLWNTAQCINIMAKTSKKK